MQSPGNLGIVPLGQRYEDTSDNSSGMCDFDVRHNAAKNHDLKKQK
jgi:hypothetical protein